MTNTNSTGLAMLMLTALLPALAAQRLDGCSGNTVSPLSDQARDYALRNSGHPLNESSLASALEDSNPSIRSLAALKLASLQQKKYLAPLMRAWAAERDTCSRFQIENALSQLLGRVWRDEPGPHAVRVVPFQPCAPSGTAGVSLRVEQSSVPSSYDGPQVRITARNLTSETLPFMRSADPTELFSVTVLDPTGQRAKIPIERSCLYGACDTKSGLTQASFTFGSSPFFMPLPPQEDVSLIWGIGQEFDMSAPGIYSVSIGAKLDFLDATICSNTAYVTVK